MNSSPQSLSDSMLLGNLQKGSLDIMGAVVELAAGERSGLEWILRIQNPSMCSVFEAATPSKDSALEWITMIHETGQNASVRVSSPIRFPRFYGFSYLELKSFVIYVYRSKRIALLSEYDSMRFRHHRTVNLWLDTLSITLT